MWLRWNQIWVDQIRSLQTRQPPPSSACPSKTCLIRSPISRGNTRVFIPHSVIVCAWTMFVYVRAEISCSPPGRLASLMSLVFTQHARPHPQPEAPTRCSDTTYSNNRSTILREGRTFSNNPVTVNLGGSSSRGLSYFPTVILDLLLLTFITLCIIILCPSALGNVAHWITLTQISCQWS